MHTHTHNKCQIIVRTYIALASSSTTLHSPQTTPVAHSHTRLYRAGRRAGTAHETCALRVIQ